MSSVYFDRIRETTTTTGTGTVTLGGAATGFLPFSTIGNGSQCYYIIDDGGANWEVGQGTFTLAGTTLSRTSILLNGSNNDVGFCLGAGFPLTFSNTNDANAGNLQNGRDTWLLRNAAANLQLGNVASATPVAQTLSVQNGSGTNIAGAAFRL